MSKSLLNLGKLTSYILFGYCLLYISTQTKAADNISHSHSDSVTIQYFGRDSEGFLTSQADDGFDQYLDNKLGQELEGKYHGIQAILSRNTFSYTNPTVINDIQGSQKQITELLISVLENVDNQTIAVKPILLLASARLSARLNTIDLSNPAWQTYRNTLERYHIQIISDPVKGIVIDNPAIHEAWQDYSDTSWTEDAFVLDLKNAFNCRDGNQEYHIMIREGQRFDQEHPGNPRDPWVNFVIGNTFADWYAMAEYTQRNKNGALTQGDVNVGLSPSTRNSAVQYFLKAAVGAPHSELAKASGGAIKGLLSGLAPSDIVYACVVR